MKLPLTYIKVLDHNRRTRGSECLIGLQNTDGNTNRDISSFQLY